MCLLARRPWRRRLRLDAALPSAVFGPVYFCAFRRLALIWASLGVRGSFVFFIFILAGACRPTSLSCYGERIGDSGGNFGKSLKTGGGGNSRGAVTENRLISRRLGKAREVILFQTVLLPGLGMARMANPGSILFLAKTPSPAKPTKKAHTFGRSLRVSSVQACRREARPLRF